MKEYAVLYKREFFNKENTMWILKPIRVVDIKRINGIITYDKKEIPSIDDLRILDESISLFAGEFGYENNLHMPKFNPIRLKEMKESIVTSMLNQMLIGSYDANKHSIDYHSIRLEYSDDEIESKFDYVGKTEEEIKESLIFYDVLKNEYQGDITILSVEDITLLNEIDNYEDLYNALKYLVVSKENYFLKMQEENRIYLVYDDAIKDIFKAKKINELKSNLNELVKAIDEETLNFLSNTEEEFSEISLSMNESLFNTLYETQESDELREILKIYRNSFKLTEKQKRALLKKAPKTLEFYEFCYDGLEEIMKETDLKAMKAFLKSFNEKQLELLKESEIYVLNEKRKTMEYEIDYKKVHDELVSKIIGRDTQIDRILTTIERNDKLKNSSKREAMIIAGTTGTGKTQTFVELRNALKDKRPVIIVDTNQLTQEGYVGGTIEDNILIPLLMSAHEINNKKKIEERDPNVLDDMDIELARHGIVFLDEIDKRAGKEGTVNTEGVINQLLKLMDPGTSYSVQISRMSPTIPFDTSNLTIFASGAFQEYFDKKESQSIGFTENSTKKSDYTIHHEVDPLELVKYGLDRQFIGRYDKVTLFEPHTKSSLIELETNKSTSNLQVEIDNYKSKGISFVWEDGYLEEVVERAYKMGTGGRATKNIINRSLGSLNTEVNNHEKEIKTIFVPIKALDDPGSIVLIKKNNETVLLRELMEETERKNKALKNMQKIVVDNAALEEAKTIIKKRNN